MSKLVLFTSGTLGDHLPFITLAQGLQSRGHQVLMVINQAMHPFAERAGVPAVALTDIARGVDEAQANAWAWNHWQTPRGQPHPNANPAPPDYFLNQVRELAQIAEGADLLLTSSLRPHGLAAHLLSGTPWLTVSVNASGFLLTSDMPRQGEYFEKAREHYYNIQLDVEQLLAEFGRKTHIPTYYHGVLWAEQIILGSSPHFSAPDLTQLQPFNSISQTGFWLWNDPAWDDWQPSAELDAFMQRNPLVLSFSSQPLEAPQAILYKHLFAAQQLGLPLLVQRGWAGFSQADLPDRINPNDVFFLEYAPHDWLFARACAAIQHGGIGSLARALHQACPLLIEPFGNDQFFNADRVRTLGVGAVAHPFEATADELAIILDQQVLAQPVQQRVRQMAQQLNAEDGVGQACDLIERALVRNQQEGRSHLAGRWGIVPLDEVIEDTNEQADGEISAEIPRILHQTWKDENIPPRYQAWVQTWRDNHPDWEFRLWTDADCRQLIAEHYAWFLPIYDRYPQHIMRVDAVRYFIMHHIGGVYADLDYESVRSLDPLLAGKQVVLTVEPPHHVQFYIKHSYRFNQIVCNALFASVPNHPFWEHLFEMLVAWQSGRDVLDVTGPFLITRAVENYARPDDLAIEPYQLLGPLSANESYAELPSAIRNQMRQHAYAIHHWYGVWHRDEVVSNHPAAVSVLLYGQQLPEQRVTRAMLHHVAQLPLPKPLISCLMVTRNRPKHAQRAIHSFLNQTYSHTELIIIDDGTDDTLQTWVDDNPDPRIRFYRLPDQGQSLGTLRNLSVAKSNGTYLAQWDDDDLSAPQRLELQMAAIQRYRVDACLLMREMMWLPNVALLKSGRRPWEGSALIAKASLPTYPNRSQGEDTPVVEQLIANAQVVALDMPELYLYIFHGNNTFDAAHWHRLAKQATMRYEYKHYLPALTTYANFLQIDLLTQHRL